MVNATVQSYDISIFIIIIFFHFWIWIPCCLTVLLSHSFHKMMPDLSFDNFAFIYIDQNKYHSLVCQVSKNLLHNNKVSGWGIFVQIGKSVKPKGGGIKPQDSFRKKYKNIESKHKDKDCIVFMKSYRLWQQEKH